VPIFPLAGSLPKSCISTLTPRFWQATTSCNQFPQFCGFLFQRTCPQKTKKVDLKGRKKKTMDSEPIIISLLLHNTISEHACHNFVSFLRRSVCLLVVNFGSSFAHAETPFSICQLLCIFSETPEISLHFMFFARHLKKKWKRFPSSQSCKRVYL
jgi:hypothetical protein